MVNRELAVTLARRMINDSIWKSTIIEGLHVTFPQTEAILENAPVSAKPSDVMFIINMKRAWQFLLDSLDCENNLSVLREFNKICGENLIYESGDLRKRNVRISGCKYEPEIPVYSDVIYNIALLNTISDPLYRAMSFFCYVARKQLFIDGNKRVAQLIMNKILIENGIGIFCMPQDGIKDFITALVSYYETAKPEPMFEYLKKNIYYFE